MSAERAGARFHDGRWLLFAFAAVYAYGAHSYLAVVEDVESPVCGGLSTMGDYLCPGAFRAEGIQAHTEYLYCMVLNRTVARFKLELCLLGPLLLRISAP